MAYYTNRQAPQSGLANLLALRGRQGDTELVHMSKPEINMLRSMGEITINPATGLPEAFNLEEALSGIAAIANKEMSGREAMQQLMNFGRNKIAEYNEPPVEQPTMPVQPPMVPQAMSLPQQPQQPPMPPQMAAEAMQGLPAMLSGGREVSGGGRPFEGMIDVNNNGGDGMSDDIGFKVEGDPVIKNALLSRDEYVIPADVVSELGNGSSDSGAEKLDGFLDDVRMSANGTTKQMNQIDGDKMIKELNNG